LNVSQNIYCLQKVKYIKYEQIKHYKSASDSNKFAKIIDSYNRLCESIQKKKKKKKKRNIYIGIKIGCSLALKNVSTIFLDENIFFIYNFLKRF